MFLLKTIIIVVGKLTRSKVLQGGAGLCGVPRGRDGTRKFSQSYGIGQVWDKTKLCKAGAKTSSFGPALPHCHPYNRSLHRLSIFQQ